MEKKSFAGKTVATLLPKPSSMIRLGSNICKIKIKLDKIHMYDLIINPPFEALNTREKTILVKSVHKKIKASFGHYVQSGNLLFSLNLLKDPVEFCSPEIEKTTKKCYYISFKYLKTVDISCTEKLVPGELQGMEMVLNILFHDIMSSQKYTALTRNRFFNLSNTFPVAKTDLLAMPGFFLSVSIISNELQLTIDTTTEYVRNSTCLGEINKMKEHGMKNSDISKIFFGKRVCILAIKGSGLRMHGVDFEKTPITQMAEGGKQTLLAYWEQKYHVKIKEAKQPLLYGKRGSKLLFSSGCFPMGLCLCEVLNN